MVGSSKLHQSDQFVACVDGPKQGMWFFQPDWDETVAAAQRMHAIDGRPKPILGYRSTGHLVEHPDPVNAGVFATALTYSETPNPRRNS